MLQTLSRGIRLKASPACKAMKPLQDSERILIEESSTVELLKVADIQCSVEHLRILPHFALWTHVD